MRDTSVPYCEYVFEGVGTLCGSNAFTVIGGKSYCDHHANYKAKMANTKYRTIVIDPPWKYGSWRKASSKSLYADRSFNVEINLPYPAMSLSEIAALPIPDLADDDCELYVWTTQKYLQHTFPLIKGWGFKVCETLTWCKAPMGTGQGGLFTPTTEFIVHGRIGKMPIKKRIDTTWWEWSRAWKKHSRKPEAFQDIIELISDEPRLEMFARRPRSGWSVFGNEVEGSIRLPTKRAPDACPYCAGKGEFINQIGKALRCNHCAGTGQRR
jgi:N6-adenosine-specific RNA methylase IME4